MCPFSRECRRENWTISRDGKWIDLRYLIRRALSGARSADGSDRLQLTYPPVSAGLPRWSPDATQIAYIGRPDQADPGRSSSFLPRVAAAQEVLSARSRARPDPAWSPDGKKLAFGRASVERGSRLGIYVVDLATQQVSTIPGSEKLFSPRWSPDGSHMAALNPDSTKLLLFDFKTQKWSDWINEPAIVGFPNWSQDGRYVYYDTTNTDHPTFRRVKVGETHSELVVDLKGLLRYANAPAYEWSNIAPDGSDSLCP